MSKINPLSDDLAAAIFRGKPGFANRGKRRRNGDVVPARTKHEPTEKPLTIEEKDEAFHRIRAIYGKQD